MERVFRVQDKDGRGPFRPGFSQKWVILRKDHDNLIPWYEEFGRVDQKLLDGEHGGSACRNIRQLRRWFTKREYKKLREFGYRAVGLDVDRIIAESGVQVFIGSSQQFKVKPTYIRLYP